MGLGQEVHAAEGGVALGDLGQHGPGGVGQDGLAQVVGAQQGQVVAPGQAGHPGRLERSRYMPVGPLPPPLGQLGQAGVGLGRAGGDGGHLVEAHVLDGGGLPAVGGHEVRPAARRRCGRDLVGPLGELGHEGLGHARPPRSGPGPNGAAPAPPSRSRGHRSTGRPARRGSSSDSVVVALYSARESRVRQRPSEVHLARFQINRWSCSWGSSARLAQWVKLAATTPSTSSSTTPLVPERERNTSASA